MPEKEMFFEGALAALKRGDKVRRKGWAKNVVAVYIPSLLDEECALPGIIKLYQNHRRTPYHPGSEDLLAGDWMVI